MFLPLTILYGLSCIKLMFMWIKLQLTSNNREHVMSSNILSIEVQMIHKFRRTIFRLSKILFLRN